MAEHRDPSSSNLHLRRVRAILAPLSDDIAVLNNQAALFAAKSARSGLTEAERRSLLDEVLAANAALDRIEHQFAAALVHEPIEVTGHSSIQRFRATIAGIRERLRAFGA